MRSIVLLAVLMGVAAGSHAAAAADRFDGVYEGEGTLRFGRCGRPENPRFRVVDSHISRAFGGSGAQIEAAVGPDGTVTNGSGAVRTTTAGSITGSTLSMDVTTPGCAFHYELTKRS